MNPFKVTVNPCAIRNLNSDFTQRDGTEERQENCGDIQRAGGDSWRRRSGTAGRTYVLKVVDFHFNRNIVQIWNQDETHVYATIIAIANDRLKPTGETVVTFTERAAGSPPAIKVWFYPGETIGHEFVYPKARAVELAKETHEPVLEMPTELAPRGSTAPYTKPTEPPVQALREAPVRRWSPAAKKLEIAE